MHSATERHNYIRQDISQVNHISFVPNGGWRYYSAGSVHVANRFLVDEPSIPVAELDAPPPLPTVKRVTFVSTTMAAGAVGAAATAAMEQLNSFDSTAMTAIPGMTSRIAVTTDNLCSFVTSPAREEVRLCGSTDCKNDCYYRETEPLHRVPPSIVQAGFTSICSVEPFHVPAPY